MTERMLVRYHHPDQGARLGLQIGSTVHDIGEGVHGLTHWLAGSIGRVEESISDLDRAVRGSHRAYLAELLVAAPSPDKPHFLAPVDDQDVWASGVTYERSREARQEEAVDGGDIYARVYRAARPELFFKALGSRVVGPYGEVGIRADATWNVPEPELALVFNPAMELVGFTIGNDMSSRDIEGENPLYLPQAKVYNASCALGPGILLNTSTTWPDVAIGIRIIRGGQTLFDGKTHTNQIRRTITELAGYLGRSMSYPHGVVLLTGTGVVPPGDFTLQAADVVSITIDGIGTLTNTVKVV